MKTFKIIIIAVIVIFLIVVIAGIYKFNFTDDDIYVENEKGEVVKYDDLEIMVDSPQPNSIISSPFAITGKARGTWFFEGDAPIELVDENGNVIVRKYITATGDWMTEDFVEFGGELVFEKPESNKGILIFHKDNPSGLPEHDDKIEISVLFD